MSCRYFFFLVCMLMAFSVKSQYYYKDILITKQNQENWKTFQIQKVRDIQIQSLDANNEPTPGFTCSQSLSPDFSSIITYTKSANIPASTLFATYDRNGRLVKTTDTSDTYKATTDYTYNENGALAGLMNVSTETDNHSTASEMHVWIYKNELPDQMIKIKGDQDSTIVKLVRDENGNVVEEQAFHGTQKLPTIYYYYDNDKRLTDIVRYNQKADRLLPDYIFEYISNRISSMIFVPSGSSDYQKWVYSYQNNGLKSSEFCYDKKRQLVVKINYIYNFQ